MSLPDNFYTHIKSIYLYIYISIDLRDFLQCEGFVSHVERCVIKSFTTRHFIVAHRRDFVRSITAARPPRARALSPARYTPAVIKIFKKLRTLKHFMVVATRASYDRRMHRMQPPLAPRASSHRGRPTPQLFRFFSPAAKAADPTGRREATPPRFITRRV